MTHAVVSVFTDNRTPFVSEDTDNNISSGFCFRKLAGEDTIATGRRGSTSQGNNTSSQGATASVVGGKHATTACELGTQTTASSIGEGEGI